jgi:hypothetical protein
MAMNDDDILDYIEDSRNLRATGMELEFDYDENDMLVMKPYSEMSTLESISIGLEKVGSGVTGVAGGMGAATAGFIPDLAIALPVAVKDALSAEDGKKLKAFGETFERLSKENFGSEFYRGLFDNAIDSLDLSEELKKDAKAGFNLGEFFDFLGPAYAGIKKGPQIVRGVKDKMQQVGESAQKRLDEDKGSVTVSSMGVGEMGNMVDKGLSKLAPNKGEVINLKTKTDRLNFYSKAEEVTNQLKQNKGTGQQYRQQLLKAGVKPDEIEWLGLDDVLNKGKITKQELQDQINANRIELDEVELSGGGEDVFEEFPYRIKQNFDEMSADDAYGPEYLQEQADEIFEEIKKEEPGRFIKGFTIDDAMKIAKERYDDNPIMKHVDPQTGYTITGNNDVGYSIFRSEADSSSYKNAIGTDIGMGQSRDVPYSLNEAIIRAEEDILDRGVARMAGDGTRFGEYTEPGGDNYREFLIKYNDPKVSFDDGHFDEENVIAHFRTKDRTTSDGKKVFYIEEIQSDWGQQARQRGLKPSEEELAQLKTAEQNLINRLEDSYKNVFVPKRIEKLIKENNLIIDENVKVSLESDEKLIPYNEFINNINKELEPKDPVIEKFEFLKMLRKGSLVFDGDKRYLPKRENKDGFLTITLPQTEQNVLVEQILKNRKKQFSPISKAPFITDTDKWTQLTLKRILSKAVDEGYDFVSITPGKAQMDRWNNEGVAKFYDEIVPKNAEKIVKKLDKNAIQKDKKINYNEVRQGTVYNQERFSIELTPQLKEKVKKGMVMFSATPLVVGQENE